MIKREPPASPPSEVVIIDQKNDGVGKEQETSDSTEQDSQEKYDVAADDSPPLHDPTIPVNYTPRIALKETNDPLHVSVQRAHICPTTVQEGNNELEELGIEAYDQQAYEEGVFEQVDRAISASKAVLDDTSENSAQETSRPSNINNLIRLIHDEDAVDADQTRCDTDARDDLVLRLARQERLNRSIGAERREHESVAFQSVASLPKIPRLSNTSRLASIKTEPYEVRQDVPTVSINSNRSIEAANRMETGRNSLEKGEYRPSDSEESSNGEDEDIDYEPDEVGEQSEEGENYSERQSRKLKRLADDGDYKCYESRMKAYTRDRAKKRLDNILDDGTEFKKLDEMLTIDGSLQIPKGMWDNLFEHQKTGVRWLWELHQLGTGGILGDEMGLGKTIQMIAFLTALRSSHLVKNHLGFDNLGPTVLVCPATVMHQWLQEFRTWWPPFRVAILHSTGTFSGKNRRNLIQAIHKSRGILVVSYPGVVIYQDTLHEFKWHYVVLDEGHKIRNPDAQVTLACKRFRTPHRLILSGSPVQNNLKELWSIFDFIYPGKLGTLPVFMEQFATPITQGGYANASDFQVQIAYKCSCVLRDTIKPFLLRRTKAEVNNKLRLPDRSEQVLFCKLTDKQQKLYQSYLDSPTVRDIKRGFCQIFVGLIELRKICNHPDLFDSTDCRDQIKQLKESQQKKHLEFFSEDETFCHYKKSGKMMVVDALLKLWKRENHKVLLFTQSRQMLKIFISYLKERDYKHLFMDGSTPIGVRQTMIEEFNKNEEIFIFLLTTRVGGVGVNLTGANRIIIYDPDWNPSTDIQARERAWRIGQQRHVIIYRLLTAGTIEEKIYHRQVFKLYLTNRILKNAQQKRFFKTNDLHELFTLGDNDKNIETKALFDEELQINPETIKKAKLQRKARKKNRKRRCEEALLESKPDELFSDEKLKAMRDRAKQLSRMIALQYGSKSDETVRVECRQDEVQAIPSSGKTDLNSQSSPAQPVASTAKSYDSVEPMFSDCKLKKKRSKLESNKKHVKYLVRQDIYKPDGSQDDKCDPRYKRDDYILERLFKSSNVFGALKHDKIETDSTADFKVVESEAEKVARDAIRALRESRRLCLDSSTGIPNWTGQNGQVAAKPRLLPKNKSRVQALNRINNAPSSGNESLLSSIKKRNQVNPVTLARGAFNVRNIDSDDEEVDKDFEGRAFDAGAEDMADKIRHFVLYKSAKPGEAQTDEMLDFFKLTFKPDKTAIFKAILYKMCEFQRRGDKGFWLMKSEFKYP